MEHVKEDLKQGRGETNHTLRDTNHCFDHNNRPFHRNNDMASRDNNQENFHLTQFSVKFPQLQ